VETLQQADATIQAEFGPVDILIDAAGGNSPSATTSSEQSFFDLSLDALRRAGRSAGGDVVAGLTYGGVRDRDGDPDRWRVLRL